MKNVAYHSELRALLSIRNFNSALEKHYAQMIQIEHNLEELNKHALALIEVHSTPEAQEKWKMGLKEMNHSLKAIHEILNTAKEKSKNHDRSDSSMLWEQFSLLEKTVKLTTTFQSKLTTDFGAN